MVDACCCFAALTASGRSSEYYDLEGNVADEDSAIKMSRLLQNKFVSCGELYLDILAEKPMSFLRGYLMVC